MAGFAAGVLREHWSNATPIRKIFRNAFELAELPYFNPHSFRKTLVQLGETLCQSPEGFKAWSQNLGHEGVLTTFYSYGEVQTTRQAEIFGGFGKQHDHISADDFEALVKAVAGRLDGG